MIPSDSNFVVWEQSEDTLSTSIYARNLYSMADPFPLLSQPGVHFRNPKRFPAWNSVIQFYDHWQLWMTYQDIPVGLEDKEANRTVDQVKASPNPFTTHTSIEFILWERVPYHGVIYSSTGQRVRTFSTVALQPGNQFLRGRAILQ